MTQIGNDNISPTRLSLYSNGAAYIGQTAKSVRNGMGVYIEAPFSYEGHWKDGMWCGGGVLRFDDGCEIRGQWQHGCLIGVAHQLQRDGSVWRQVWDDGLLRGISLITSATEISSTSMPIDPNYKIASESDRQQQCNESLSPSSSTTSAHRSVESWSCEECINFLEAKGLHNLTHRFREFDLSGLDLLKITSETLNSTFGIPSLGERLRIVQEIRHLRQSVKDSKSVKSGDNSPESGNDIFGALCTIAFEELTFLELIGATSQCCSVFKGLWLGKHVAIKVLYGNLSRPSELWSYMNKVSRIRHPNLALVLGVSLQPPDMLCIVSEYISFGSLMSWLHGDTKSVYASLALGQLKDTTEMGAAVPSGTDTPQLTIDDTGGDDTWSYGFCFKALCSNCRRWKMLKLIDECYSSRGGTTTNCCLFHSVDDISDGLDVDDTHRRLDVVKPIFSDSFSSPLFPNTSTESEIPTLHSHVFHLVPMYSESQLQQKEENFSCLERPSAAPSQPTPLPDEVDGCRCSTSRNSYPTNLSDLGKGSAAPRLTDVGRCITLEMTPNIHQMKSKPSKSNGAFKLVQKVFSLGDLDVRQRNSYVTKALHHITESDADNLNKDELGQTHKLFVRTVIKIAKGIALGCQYLHKSKWFHGNLKPTNVLLDESFEAKLSDFGLTGIMQSMRLPLLYSLHVPTKQHLVKWLSPLVGDTYESGCVECIPTNRSLNVKASSKAKRDKQRFSPCLSKSSTTALYNYVYELEQTITQRSDSPLSSTDPKLSHGFTHDSIERIPTAKLLRPLNWLPPEVVVFQDNFFCVNEKSEVYSFACILWEMLTNIIPHKDMTAVQYRLAVGVAMLPPDTLQPTSTLEELLSKCLSADQHTRPRFRDIVRTLVKGNLSAQSVASLALVAFMGG